MGSQSDLTRPDFDQPPQSLVHPTFRPFPTPRPRKSTLGKGRLDENPLVLAATKSIIGHTEGSAGVAGSMAVAILHFSKKQVLLTLKRALSHIKIHIFISLSFSVYLTIS